MSPFILSGAGVFFFITLLLLLFLVVACAMGVIDFRWKPERVLPLKQEPPSTGVTASMRNWLEQSLSVTAEVELIEDVFRVTLPADCTLADEVVLASLTSKFSRHIFSIRRSAPVASVQVD